MNDLFAAQPLIIAHLTDQVTGVRLVQGIRDLSALHERPGTTPAAYVMYDGQELRMGAGQAQVVDQKWLIMVVTRHVRDTIQPSGERQEAGPLLIHVCRALLGWRPGSEYGAFSLVNAPNPSFRDGFGYYSLRFITRLTIQPAS